MPLARKFLPHALAVVVVFAIPVIAFADSVLSRFIQNIIASLIQPLILFIFALAFLLFIAGVGRYMMSADNPKERAKGTQHILWGIIGFFIMLSVQLILNVLLGTFKITPPPGTL